MEINIRSAREYELPLLAGVERSAASIFAQVPELASSECDYPPISVNQLENFDVFVAVRASPLHQPPTTDKAWLGDTREHIVGYVALRLLDMSVFVAKISVSQDFQRQGVGTALLQRAVTEARKYEHRMVMSLTTFLDIQWNGKWYSRFGFEEVDDSEVDSRLGAEHTAILQISRAKHQRLGWRWVVMAKDLYK